MANKLKNLKDGTREFLGMALEHRVASLAFMASFLMVFGGWIWTWIELKGISQPLIIHFNEYMGITKTGSFTDVSWLGVFGISAVLVNFLIALEMEKRGWFWGKFMSLANIFLATLIFIGFLVIMNVN